MRKIVTLVGLTLALPFNLALASDKGSRTMEEVVVTATKREESIQEVPIAVSAFTGRDLAKRGVQDFHGLMEVSPSIAIQQSSNSAQGGSIRIRGVGTAGSNPGLEAAVGTFIDGIYRSRAGQAFSDLGDIERIEILRGPQGTLFGKNTVAGAVNVITNKPQFENNSSVSFAAGNYDSKNIKGFVNTFVSEELAFRLSYSWNERDGFVEDINTNDVYQDRDRYSLKGQVLWVPTDEIEARLIVDYTEKDETCCVASYIFFGSRSPLVQGLGGNSNLLNKDSTPKAGVNYEPFERTEDQGVSLDLSWDFSENITLKSLTGYREFRVHRSTDPDFSSADILGTLDTVNTFDNFSQEFHFIATADKFDFFVGAYIYSEDLYSDEVITFASAGPAYIATLNRGAAPASTWEGNPSGRRELDGNERNQGYDGVYETETTGWSLFTHDVWHTTDKLAFTLGVRFSHEKKEGGGIINGAAPGTAINDPFCAVRPSPGSWCNNNSFDVTIEDDEFTGTVKVAYQLFEDVNTYFGVSRGYKSGGINLDQQAADLEEETFDPEVSTGFELGLKSNLFDYRLTLNSALFYTRFESFQLNTFTGDGFIITNTDKVISKGIELESVFALSEIMTLTFGVTYADARYGDDKPALADETNDLAGRRLNLAPLWQGSGALFVEDNLPGSAWTYALNINWSHVGETNTGSDLIEEKIRGAYNKWNAQVGFTSPSGKYSAMLWGRNLGNTVRSNVGFNTPVQGDTVSTFLAIGRTYGVTVSAFLD
ncbi:MAG: TonB-dependent receptor [Pseudomonadales bacterium]|nr:TonB-dependent receptor [Pseudomonadales bacterium]